MELEFIEFLQPKIVDFVCRKIPKGQNMGLIAAILSGPSKAEFAGI